MPAVVRPDKPSSKPAMQVAATRNAAEYYEPVSFLQMSGPPSPAGNRKRAHSTAASSFVLPIERGSREFASETPSNHTSFPPYLKNMSPASQPKVSRFSWTNSQAPKTPMDPRVSVATSTSSVARYRTVESWVSNQTKRLSSTRVQDHLQQGTSSSVPKVPSMPSTEVLSAIPSAPATPVTATAVAVPMHKTRPSLARVPGGGNANTIVPTVPEETTWPFPISVPEPVAATHTRTQSKHQTQGSDATVFRAHPGTKLKSPVNSRIPSEILDKKISADGALSQRGTQDLSA
jgi:hypothetical protein